MDCLGSRAGVPGRWRVLLVDERSARGSPASSGSVALDEARAAPTSARQDDEARRGGEERSRSTFAPSGIALDDVRVVAAARTVREGVHGLRVRGGARPRPRENPRGTTVAMLEGMTSRDDSPDPSARYVILAAVDDTPSAELVVREASQLATSMGAELHLVHVVESLGLAAVTIGGSPLAMPSAGELLREGSVRLQRYAMQVQRRESDLVFAHLRVGAPWREIVQLATSLSADLLILGTHDAKGLERLFLGSRAEVILRAAPCPVLVAREKVPHRADVPEILPPCPECLAAQKASRGATLWCSRHDTHHPRAHVYSETPESFALGSQTFRDA